MASARADVKARATWLAPAILLLVVAVFGLLTLTNFPAIFVDEGSNSNRAWSLLQTGRAFASVDNGVYQQYDGYWTYFPYLGALLQAAFVWAFGLSVASLRLTSLFFGLILLLIIYVIANKLYGPRTGMIAMALLATSAPFVLSSHLGRHDIIVTALGFGAVALYITDRGSSLSLKSVLCGLAIGLGLDIHFNVLVFVPVMIAFYWLDYGLRFLRTGRFWGFVAGGLLGAFYFAAMHIFQYPQTYFAMASLGNGTSRTPPIFTVDLPLWQGSFASTIGLLDLLLLPVMVSAAILLVRRQSRADVRTAALVGMLILSVAALIKYKAPYYAILLAPAVSLLLAPYLKEVTQRVGSIRQWTFWRNLLVLTTVVAVAAINLAPALRASNDEFPGILSYFRQTIPDGSLVYGTATYWLAVPNTRYINWEQIIFRQRQTPGSTFTDAVEALKPDYLVVDGFVQTFTYDDDYCHANYLNFPCIPRAEFDTLFKQEATLAGELHTTGFGDILIYKMSWDSKNPAGSQR